MKTFSSTFINRPVLATVLALAIILFGLIGFSFLGVREYPSVDPPVVTVSTVYVGANADVIESQITEPLEESINGIAGIRTLSSVSRDGASTITVEFEIGTDMEAATNDVRDRVSRAIRSLPPDVDPPVVIKSDADANPIFAITLQSDRRNLIELSEIANNVFKERLQTIAGVSEIRIWGEKRYSIKLLIDPLRLAGYGLTPGDIRNALQRENIELPSGRVEGYRNELSIRTFGRLNSPEEFNQLIIRETANGVIKLNDVGRADLLPENERTLLRGNNAIPQVGIALTPQPGANHINIVDEALQRIEDIRRDLPSDLRINIALNTTKSIRRAISEVQETILIAFILVVLVIFLFLRHWRSTLIPVLAIPISLIGSFFIMYVAGFSINILTLLSIVLATGLVVDDAIVVMENIYSKIEKGYDPITSGHEGTKEIFFAIISTTITLSAVFLPIIFLQGLTGKLFREFGIVMAGSVIISSVVSLTLTPMISSRWLKKDTNPNRLFALSERIYLRMVEWYRRTLNGIMTRKWIAGMVMFFSLGIIFLLWRAIPAELAPLEDKSRFVITSVAPEGTSFELMDQYVFQILQLVDTLEEKESIMAITAPGFGSSASTNSGFVRVMLKDPSERKKTQQQLADEIFARIRQWTFARSFVTQEQTIGGGRGGGLPVQFVLQAQSMEKLREFLPLFMNRCQSSPVFQMLDVNLRFNKPEVTIRIDREQARRMGVTVRDIAETLQYYFSGQRWGFFIRNNKQYSIIGQADRSYRDEPLDLAQATVRNNRGDLIPLQNLIELDYRSNPPQLYRFNRYASATVSASTTPEYTLGQGIEEMRKIALEVLDETFSTSLAGVSREFTESSNTLMFALLLALILIYMILAAQFESYRDPLIIMLTVPLAFAGALISLWLTGSTMNIFSQIGIIMLIGIVTKNGILIVEFANQKKSSGMTIADAAVEAAVQRFRPILMTNFATILGAVPIAIALGAGSTSRTSMGIVIIGGLIFSLFLTLYVVPSLYTLLTKKIKSVSGHAS